MQDTPSTDILLQVQCNPASTYESAYLRKAGQGGLAVAQQRRDPLQHVFCLQRFVLHEINTISALSQLGVLY